VNVDGLDQHMSSSLISFIPVRLRPRPRSPGRPVSSTKGKSMAGLCCINLFLARTVNALQMHTLNTTLFFYLDFLLGYGFVL